MTVRADRDGSGTAFRTTTTSYDRADLVTGEVANGVPVVTNTYAAADQLTGDGATGRSYDPAANRIDGSLTVGAGNRISGDGTWSFSHDAAGRRLEKTDRRFADEHVLMAAVRNLAEYVNRSVGDADHSMDARLLEPEKFRVHVIVPPASRCGVCVSIRKFKRSEITLDKLVVWGSLPAAAAEYLRLTVAGHRNLVVSGGTGSGKTTMLNALSGAIPDHERVVTIEDTAELQLKRAHVVTLQGRQSNQEGAGAVTIRDLVRNALRMRPDRIVVGECRGEAIDMLQAMNTGYDGSMTTLHVNTPDGVVRRLEVLVQQNADSDLPVESIHAQVAAAVDLVVHGTVVRSGKKRKVVTEITEFVEVDPKGGIRMVPLFKRGADGELRATFLPDRIAGGLVKDAVDFVRAVETGGAA